MVLAFEVPPVEEMFSFKTLVPIRLGPVDASLSGAVLLLFLATFLVGLFFWAAARRPALVPKGVQNLAEAVVDFVREGIVMEVMGPEGLRWLPLLVTMFAFIFVNNVFEVIPGISFPVTSRMGHPATLAFMSLFVFNVAGVQRHGLLGYLKHLLSPPPGLRGVMGVVVSVIFIPIEVISTLLVRPLTLAVRLFANMMAGHIILTIFYVATAAFLQPKLAGVLAVAPLGLAVALTAFEILVAALQAYIFTILTAVYISLAVQAHH